MYVCNSCLRKTTGKRVRFTDLWRSLPRRPMATGSQKKHAPMHAHGTARSHKTTREKRLATPRKQTSMSIASRPSAHWNFMLYRTEWSEGRCTPVLVSSIMSKHEFRRLLPMIDTVKPGNVKVTAVCPVGTACCIVGRNKVPRSIAALAEVCSWTRYQAPARPQMYVEVCTCCYEEEVVVFSAWLLCLCWWFSSWIASGH